MPPSLKRCQTAIILPMRYRSILRLLLIHYSAYGFMDRIVKHLDQKSANQSHLCGLQDLRGTLGQIRLEDNRYSSHFGDILNILSTFFSQLEVATVLLLVCQLVFWDVAA